MRYGNDFILEDGEWKIWHLHVFGIFMCPVDKNWAKWAMSRGAADASRVCA